MEARVEPADEFDAIGVREILDADSRPTFVLDLDPDEESSEGLAIRPLFCNAALRLHEQLFDALVGNDAQGLSDIHTPGEATYEEFTTWATGCTSHDDSKDVFPQTFRYGNLLWTGSTVRQRWRLISGNSLWKSDVALGDLSSGTPLEKATGGIRAEQSVKSGAAHARPQGTTQSVRTGSTTAVSSKPPPTSKPAFYPQSSVGSSDETGKSSQSSSIPLETIPEKAVTDWTSANPKGSLSPHIEIARAVNWAVTPLGAMETWTPGFRQLANLCMGNPHPAALFWGSELTMLYNEAYAREVAGNKHPNLMGTGFSGPFSELWEYTSPIFAECARTGKSVRMEDDYLPIDRHGLLEETFYSWSFTPLYGDTGHILGFYNAPFETTNQVISRRRLQLLSRIGVNAAHATTVKQFWGKVVTALQEEQNDIPFALLYSVGDSEEADHSSISSGSTISQKVCHLEGSIGVPEGHLASPSFLDLKRSREGFVPSFREAMRTREPTLLHTRDGTLPEALLEGIEWRGFGDPCREAIIFPLRPTNGDSVLAFLVLGVNPRRPYDDEYKEFTSLLNRQLATTLASTILFEDEVRRSRDAAEAAALEKEHLTQQLDLQASRLRRMTELSPLGMFLIGPDGVLREANDRFYEMTSHTRDGQYELSWMDLSLDSSRKHLEEGWHKLVDEHLAWTGELQLKTTAMAPCNLNGEPIDYWVIFTAHPELKDDGSLRSIMGSITDISDLKWAQGLQQRQLQEAEENRRRQNEFIDITSHELRNPLSAVLQCADDLLGMMTECRLNGTAPTPDMVEASVQNAQTIALCVQHQKAIVDDVLTISKLDSNLLVITPVAAQPEAIMNRAVKMFEAELQAKDIEVVYENNPSYEELKVDWVSVDPSRVLQILINLMTNAIKFTAPAPKRVITVSVGATLTPPDGSDISGFTMVPSKVEDINLSTSDDWGTGEILYIRFKVEDTGCGLSPDEKQMLFQRFKQASPRTHAQYGGSGLGLFISKRLAELHGGQIGVASESGVGSLFGFYVQARRTSTPGQSLSQEVLPIERALGGADMSLNQQVTPQRQDLAGAGPIASILATKSVVQPQFDPKTIFALVVEDNEINQKVLVNQLRKAGCVVNAANDGLEALAFLEHTSFRKQDGQKLSVILMDLEMPNMDGLTCVREIRKLQNERKISRHVPVIAVTANVRNEQLVAARQSGMDDVVSKPFRIPDLLKKIETLLEEVGDR